MTGTFLLAALVLLGASVRAQQQQSAQPRTFLLFVDDLHLEFRGTPRLRDLAGRLVRDLSRDGDLWSIATTGTSSVSVAPTADVAAVHVAIRRLTGNGLSLRELLDARQQVNVAREVRRRSSIAFATAADAVSALSKVQPQRPLTVLYVSHGYDPGLSAEPAALIGAVAAAKAAVYAIDPSGLSSGVAVQGGNPGDLATVIDATRGSLRTLAMQTQGVAVFTAAELDAAFVRIMDTR